MTYSGCVFVDLGNQHAMRMRHIAMYGLPGFTVFCHIISQMVQFLKRDTEHKMFFFSKTFT
jgi:hypothetical protein